MSFVSRNTIKKYQHIFLGSGLSYESFSAMSDLELSQKFLVATHPEKSQRKLDLEAMLPGILTYVEAVESQKEKDLIRACENSLIYFEGAPLVVLTFPPQ